MKIHVPDLDCDIDSCSGGPITTNQELPTGPDTKSSPDFENIERGLPPTLSKNQHLSVYYIDSFQQSLSHHNTKTKTPSKVSDTVEQPVLDWQIEENWGGSYQTDNYQSNFQKSQFHISEVLIPDLADCMDRKFYYFLEPVTPE